MGLGGSSGSSGSSSSYGSSTSSPVLFNWEDIMPSWVSTGQQNVLPWLMSRAQEGFSPKEEKTLWSGIQDQLADASASAGKKLSRQVATSGMSASSPMVASAFSDLASDSLSSTSKAAMDFAKLKLGQKDTAIGQLLTALYTPSPSAVGTQSSSSQSSTGYTPSQQSGGMK